MALVPDTKQGKVTFFRGKVAPWTSNATAIGIDAAIATAFDGLVEAAELKLAAQTSAEGAYRAAVEEADLAVEAMARAGADIISAVRNKARTAGNGVYALAQIPAPATPGPVGDLGQPRDFTAELLVNGSLKLKWKNANPKSATGVVYQIWRRNSPEGQFEYLGGCGGKMFIDGTIPAGSSQVTYQIQAVRSTSMGAFAQFNVNFGVGGSTTVTATPVTKIAA